MEGDSVGEPVLGGVALVDAVTLAVDEAVMLGVAESDSGVPLGDTVAVSLGGAPSLSVAVADAVMLGAAPTDSEAV